VRHEIADVTQRGREVISVGIQELSNVTSFLRRDFGRWNQIRRHGRQPAAKPRRKPSSSAMLFNYRQDGKRLENAEIQTRDM